jgi:hypothetical protein
MSCPYKQSAAAAKKAAVALFSLIIGGSAKTLPKKGGQKG